MISGRPLSWTLLTLTMLGSFAAAPDPPAPPPFLEKAVIECRKSRAPGPCARTALLASLHFALQSPLTTKWGPFELRQLNQTDDTTEGFLPVRPSRPREGGTSELQEWYWYGMGRLDNFLRTTGLVVRLPVTNGRTLEQLDNIVPNGYRGKRQALRRRLLLLIPLIALASLAIKALLGAILLTTLGMKKMMGVGGLLGAVGLALLLKQKMTPAPAQPVYPPPNYLPPNYPQPYQTASASENSQNTWGAQ